MKSLILSTFDTSGGAARACYRLHQGLKSLDTDSQMLVQQKSSDDQTVISPQTRLQEGLARARITFDLLPLKLYPKRQSKSFSLQWLPENISQKVKKIDPDIINLHWINQAFVQIETLAKFKKPIVWTLHDMWAFTGGCHYNEECVAYKQSCGSCPQLNSSKASDLSHWVWQRKAKAWENLNLTVVTPSTWLAKCAQASSLFGNKSISVIPYGLDLDVYRPIDPKKCRDLLGLPQDKKLLLFTSLKATSDKRKGLHLLQLALEKFKQTDPKKDLELVVVGASFDANAPDFKFKTHYLGTLNDDLTLALTYSAVDAFIAPSVQDNLPNTVLEALACGTPCIAFKIGGMPDMIEHQNNGYLANSYQIEDLALGISWVLENPQRYLKLSDNARKKAEQEFALKLQATRYLDLFSNIVTG